MDSKNILPPLFASLTSCLITHPIDVIKVRRQINMNNIGLFRMTTDIIKNEGLSKLYKGINASVLRNGIFVSSKFIAYDIFKNIIKPDSFEKKVICGMAAGATGAIIGTPFDLVMVRLQSDKYKYNSIPNAFKEIYMKEGIKSYWKGCDLTIKRAIIVTACQFAVYDQMKENLNKHIDEGMGLYILSSICSSIIASIASNPIDMCKTRRMNNLVNDNIKDIIRKEGVLSLWKGLEATMCRQIPLNIVRFTTLELIRKMLG